MNAVLALAAIMLIVGVGLLIESIEEDRARRRRVAEEQLLAEHRLRQAAQAGLRAMLDEARRRSS